MHLNSLGLCTVVWVAALVGAVPVALADVNINAHPAPAYSDPPAPARRLVARMSVLIPNPWLDADTELARRAFAYAQPADPGHRARYFASLVTSTGEEGDPHGFKAAIDHHAHFYELNISLKKAGKATRLDAAAWLRTDIATEGAYGMHGPLDIQGVVREIVRRMVREAKKGPYPSGTAYEYALESALRDLQAMHPGATLVQSPEAGARVNASLNKLRRPVSLRAVMAAAAASKSVRAYMQITSFSADAHDAQIAGHVGFTPVLQPATRYGDLYDYRDRCDLSPRISFTLQRGFWQVVSRDQPVC